MHHFMAQPWNTISNGVFFLVALVLWWQIRQNKTQEDKALIGLIASIALIGASSTFWHATMYSWSLLIDIAGILIFTIYYIYYVALKRLGRSAGHATLALLGLVAACVIAMKLTPDLPQRSGAFIPLVLLFIGLATKFWSISKEYAAYFFGAAVTMGLAIVARIYDVPSCEYFSMGTHFLWHSLTALTTYCLMIPIIHSHR